MKPDIKKNKRFVKVRHDKGMAKHGRVKSNEMLNAEDLPSRSNMREKNGEWPDSTQHWASSAFYRFLAKNVGKQWNIVRAEAQTRLGAHVDVDEVVEKVIVDKDGSKYLTNSYGMLTSLEKTSYWRETYYVDLDGTLHKTIRAAYPKRNKDKTMYFVADRDCNVYFKCKGHIYKFPASALLQGEYVYSQCYRRETPKPYKFEDELRFNGDFTIKGVAVGNKVKLSLVNQVSPCKAPSETAALTDIDP